MSESDTSKPTLRFRIDGFDAAPASSRVHASATRGTDRSVTDPSAPITIERRILLSAPGRGAPEPVTLEVEPDTVLALEMEDGLVLYTSAGGLARDLTRLGFEADGALRLDALRARGEASRGLGDWLLRALSVVGMGKDAVLEAAVDEAKEVLGEKIADLAEKGVAWALTKILMWAIERPLRRREGLRPWGDPEGGPIDPGRTPVADFADWRPDEPLLVFVHGTASSTVGSFGDLRAASGGADWDPLIEKFGRHVYGFEHRTFSESPIDNALALAEALPPRARLSVVTHSRGGLIGDLLCADGLASGLIDRYRHRDRGLADVDQAARDKLLSLGRLLAQKRFDVERYVRVACPAQGTLLASGHLDTFLSVLLHLVGLVPALQTSVTYAVVKRLVLQVVKNRTDPRLVPGIEAMLPDSPFAALIGQTSPRAGAEAAVIAGDIEAGGLKGIGAFLTDHLFFQGEDNDLVVDTDSMFGGLPRRSGKYLFDQGPDVNHFRYFSNQRTRRAIRRWLTAEKTEELREFEPLAPAPRRATVRAARDEARPVVFVVPGILGSHLKVGERDRVWLDFPDIVFGGMEKIQYDKPDVRPDDLFGLVYDDLCRHLAEAHRVVRFAYDWRRPLHEEAERLATAIEDHLRAAPPVRILSHSMGGLLVRAMIARRPDVWGQMARCDGSRWVMLGTPNRGSHAMVETLLGLSATVRQLAVVDLEHDIDWLLRTVAAFPGALQLLPRPGFADAGGLKRDYYSRREWEKLKEANDDFWLGKALGAVPASSLLDAAKAEWAKLDESLPDIGRIAYVAGCGHLTPCGVEIDEKRGRLRMLGTRHGDGQVSHASGLLECLTQEERVWYSRADHAGLASSEEMFPAISELLASGTTTRLSKVRPAVRGGEAKVWYEAGPVLYPTEEGLARQLVGGRGRPRRRGRAKHKLTVSCHAMDLRHARDPILVGHCEGDPISGPEAQIDRHVVHDALTIRYRLGDYAGALGTANVVLLKPNTEQEASGVRRGAIVVGLGELGRLTTVSLSEAVRIGVTRYLLQVSECQDGAGPEAGASHEVGLAALLLGCNSTTSISVEDSVLAVLRGVIEANRQFAETTGSGWRVGRVELVELFLDKAITAAHAIAKAAERLRPEAERAGCRIDAAATLERGVGVRQRLEATTDSSYWARLIVTSADRRAKEHDEDPEEPLPPAPGAPEHEAEETAAPSPGRDARRPELARSLSFTYLSQRARAESVAHRRQPGLAETLVECSIRDTTYKPDLSRTLFHLLVPHELKEAVRRTESLVLVLDGYTANLPWEMMAADDEPLVRSTAVVRQLSSTRYRLQPRRALSKAAYVVNSPSTEGYYPTPRDPGRSSSTGLDPLPGAQEEAQAVAMKLKSQGYEVVEAPEGSEGRDVINKLFQQPYRVIHVSAHGVFRERRGELVRTGVVLSDGMLLTTAEIGQLEIVPDLVFLNCCMLGGADNTPATAYNRLAYSVARELIEMGVRCVVAAGWAVDDEAGKCFAETFYESFVGGSRPFGAAIHEARRQTYLAHGGSNTWGAYQAYGDPAFVIDPRARAERGGAGQTPVATQELVSSIEACWAEAHYEKKRGPGLDKRVRRLLDGAPRDWREKPEVLYALARYHGEVGSFDEARRGYQDAISVDDMDGVVPAKAIEQLANLEARQGGKTKDVPLIKRAIARMLGLAQAATGDGDSMRAPLNAERCAMLGSAYKRLAAVLASASAGPEIQDDEGAVQGALESSADWYRKAAGEPGQPGFSPYCAQNRLAIEAVLGTHEVGAAERARTSGEVARQRYATSRDYFDLIMAGDGLLIERLIDGSLSGASDGDPTAEQAVQEIVTRYQELRDQLPETDRELASVTDQIELLALFVEKRAEEAGDGTAGTAKKLATRLRRIASELVERKTEESRTH